MFWRTYGKEGTGCALAFPMTCFEGQSNLFRVRYGKGAVETCLDTLSELLEEYGKIPGAPDFTSMSRIEELPTPLVNVLSPLVYLYKSQAYEYEQEVRIVIPFFRLGERVIPSGVLGNRHAGCVETLRGAPEPAGAAAVCVRIKYLLGADGRGWG